jgi:hypothetical protein
VAAIFFALSDSPAPHSTARKASSVKHIGAHQLVWCYFEKDIGEAVFRTPSIMSGVEEHRLTQFVPYLQCS